ncbi:hypothetical protein AJ79_02407 [Helicocarpus griseus UAMH5409]|uniref:Amidohydrolase-related domain-containing protein n=1 Tax=Helicocarpus griseus UAMH5409 TaxID=1447875 RepID=A0A2B7Y309_9EURO|nr:hypothetical protein AJ79_02407 [Helicocarpus griseus UAMH5409]
MNQQHTTIPAVRLPHKPPNTLWTIIISPSTNTITSIAPYTPTPDSQSQPQSNLRPLALPPLTHPHIHLDKAHLHSSPLYTSLHPTTGTFTEALHTTTTAKALFTHSDLLTRGRWLLAASVEAGVTAMRAFVEVDGTVGLKCLEAALVLKEEWRARCTVQIACFAQEPLFTGENAGVNRRLLEEAVGDERVEVLGTTPYVEGDEERGRRNVKWAVERALVHGKHLDFHLDYHLEGGKGAMVWFVLETLCRLRWVQRTRKRVMLGHCTRLTLFGEKEWRELAGLVRENALPVTFVGLPTSDIYMACASGQGLEKEKASSVRQQPRGTLPVPSLIRTYGLDAVLGVNNVGNAFTPWGSADPLSVASLGVGLYQAGTKADAELLYECVSTRARRAMGLPVATADGLGLSEGDPGEVLLVDARKWMGGGDGDGEDGGEVGIEVVPRSYGTVAEVVWDPPVMRGRRVVKCGMGRGKGR